MAGNLAAKDPPFWRGLGSTGDTIGAARERAFWLQAGGLAWLF